MSNYPPGVTGMEPEIAGPDHECPICDGPIWHYGDECEECPKIRQAAIEKIQDAASALDAADFELSKAIWEATNTEPNITFFEIHEAATACGDVGSIFLRCANYQDWRDDVAKQKANHERTGNEQ